MAIDTESAQLVEAGERRHANESLRGQPVPEVVPLVDLCVAPSDRPEGGEGRINMDTSLLSLQQVADG